MATSCWWPPDSAPGRCFARAVSPTRSSAASTRCPAIGGRRPANRERILDVLVDRHVADQVEALEDQADVDVARARALGRRQLAGGAAVEPVAPRRRGVEQRQNRQERRFPAARRAGDGDVLAAADVDGDVRQRARVFVGVALEDLGDALEANERQVEVVGRGRSGSGFRFCLAASPPRHVRCASC